jgi:hypothetical protein
MKIVLHSVHSFVSVLQMLKRSGGYKATFSLVLLFFTSFELNVPRRASSLVPQFETEVTLYIVFPHVTYIAGVAAPETALLNRSFSPKISCSLDRSKEILLRASAYYKANVDPIFLSPSFSYPHHTLFPLIS